MSLSIEQELTELLLLQLLLVFKRSAQLKLVMANNTCNTKLFQDKRTQEELYGIGNIIFSECIGIVH